MPIHRLVCVGVNFRTAPVEYREKLGSDLPVRCEQVCGRAQAESNGDGEAIRELAWLSTCNRVELYAVCGKRSFRGDDAARTEVQRKLMNDEMKIRAERLLRDLKQDAFIEYR